MEQCIWLAIRKSPKKCSAISLWINLKPYWVSERLSWSPDLLWYALTHNFHAWKPVWLNYNHSTELIDRGTAGSNGCFVTIYSYIWKLLFVLPLVIFEHLLFLTTWQIHQLFLFTRVLLDYPKIVKPLLRPARRMWAPGLQQMVLHKQIKADFVYIYSRSFLVFGHFYFTDDFRLNTFTHQVNKIKF